MVVQAEEEAAFQAGQLGGHLRIVHPRRELDMDLDKLFRALLDGLAQATPIIAQAPAFGRFVQAAIDAFDGDARQDELKAAYAAAKDDSDAAQVDFGDASQGR